LSDLEFLIKISVLFKFLPVRIFRVSILIQFYFITQKFVLENSFLSGSKHQTIQQNWKYFQKFRFFIVFSTRFVIFCIHCLLENPASVWKKNENFFMLTNRFLTLVWIKVSWVIEFLVKPLQIWISRLGIQIKNLMYFQWSKFDPNFLHTIHPILLTPKAQIGHNYRHII